jgi:hypothetical protein
VNTLADVRAAGHVAVSDDGVFVDTESTDSTSKAAEYWPAAMALGDTGTPSLSWVGDGAKPGMQLVVDFDGNGTQDAILVGEDGTYGTGNTLNWWVSDAAAAFVKTGAPSHASGFGSTNNGTLAQWRTAFPHAKVLDYGFSLGSGVKGSGLLKSAKLGATTYQFAGKAAPTPVTTAPTGLKSTATDTGSVSLAWTAVPGAESYRLFRTDLTGNNVGASAGSSIVAQGLKSNTSYGFQVAAVGADGTTGPKSAVLSVKTASFTFTAPTGLKCVKATTSLHCTANNVVGANRYGWYVNGVAHGSSDSATAGYDIVSLTKGTSYQISVAADNDTQGPGPQSAQIKYTTLN